MNHAVLGQYVPIDSKIHRIDPRVKIIMMIVLMVSVFMVPNFQTYAFLFVVLSIAVLMSKLTFRFILSALKPMFFMLFFLSIINIFLIRTGTPYKILFFTVYSDAIKQTLFIVFRLTLMIMVTTLLTATTSPIDMTLGIEDLLSPLKRFKVPAHEIAMMLSIVFRFIPTLIEDTQRIMNAQASRGVDLEEGSFKEKISGIVSMIVPLFLSSYQRSEDLADAMEARGYYPGKTRTRYKQLQIRFSDLLMLSLSFFVFATVLYMRKIA